MVFSDDLILLIDDINNNKACIISNFLNDFINDKYNQHNYNLNFIDYNPDSKDIITFIGERKIKKEHAAQRGSYESFILQMSSDQNTWISNRTSIKVGRFIKRLTTAIKLTDKDFIDFTDAEIEFFVNSFKAFIALKHDSSRFEIVEGEDIRKFYLCQNYQNQKGQLGQSCMKYKKCQGFLDIYVHNTDVCRLVILKGIGTEKIVGRALLWTDRDGDLYLDRAYCISDSDMILFADYARQLGCFTSYEEIFRTENYPFIDVEVILKNVEFELYPYMDSFQYFYKKLNTLCLEVIENDYDYHEMEMTNGYLLDMASENTMQPRQLQN
jgi:hypothetical protein